MDNEKPNTLNKLLKLIIVISVVLIACISCKSVQYVPVPRVKTHTERSNNLRIDSVYSRDSIYLHEYIRGDTVYRDKLVDRWRDRKREVHDTVYINRTDSIYVPYTVEVEKELGVWERVKVSIGGAAILFCVLLSLLIFFITSRRK